MPGKWCGGEGTLVLALSRMIHLGTCTGQAVSMDFSHEHDGGRRALAADGTVRNWSGMGNNLAGAGAFVEGHDLLAAKPDGELTVPFAYLDRGSRHGRLAGNPIKDPVIRKIAFPADFALFHPKAFPGPITGERREGLLLPAIHRPLVRGRMGPLVQPVTPGQRLPVQIVQIAKMHAGPKRRLHHADTALDLPFRLWGIGLTDPRSHPKLAMKSAKSGFQQGV